MKKPDVKTKSEREQLADFTLFIDKAKEQVLEMEYLDDEEEEALGPDQKAFIAKISQSNATILTQLERLTNAALSQVKKLEQKKVDSKSSLRQSYETRGSSVDVMRKISVKENGLLIPSTSLATNHDNSNNDYNTQDTNNARQMQGAESELAEAYRNLDKSRRRLRNIKSLVFQDDDSGSVRDELGDDNYFKLREIADQIAFTNQEIAQLKEQESNLTKYNDQQKEKLDEYLQKVKDMEKRDQDLRKMIREQKAQHRDLSHQRRDESVEDRKVFSKFVNAHDEKLILRQHAKQIETSPRNSNSA